MQRFPDRVDDNDGVFSPEAKEYGIGAFSWIDNDGDGLLYIAFRYPDKVYTNSAGEQIGVGSIPVNDGRWTWDGNRDKPTINPSIAFTTMRGESTEWEETFHGFIHDGILKVLD